MNLDFLFALGASAFLTAAYLWVSWLLYVLVMGLYRAWLTGRLRGLALVMGLPIVLVALVIDWLANWTIATIIFMDFPDSTFELVTGRLTRYVSAPYRLQDWRRRIASNICEHLLDLFDPTGQHCR